MSFREKIKMGSQCNDFPCSKLENFAKWRTWIDHKNCIKNLERMKEIGVEEWLKEQA